MSPAKVPRWIRRPEERPQELLDAAIEVFSTNGYRATRLEQVAEAAGVTKGSIYYYFDSKEELLTQALQSRIGAIFGGIEGGARRAEMPAADRLRAVLRSAWKHWCKPETARMHRLIMGELSIELPQLFDVAMRAGPMRVWQFVGEIMRDGQERGELGTHFDPHAAARFVVSGLMHQALLQTDLQERGLDDTPPDEIFDTALEVLLHGIAPAPAKPAAKPTAKPAAKRSAAARGSP